VLPSSNAWRRLGDNTRDTDRVSSRGGQGEKTEQCREKDFARNQRSGDGSPEIAASRAGIAGKPHLVLIACTETVRRVARWDFDRALNTICADFSSYF
jgi:hypothetical protein